ncbi:hypothetical protein EYF80_028180 [Liparis tanakae]|uniref:Uncharacterized protein n=1 Tax=Liparis tanakae TaxID=230148 RepID=A0A4Z2H6M5_9TELE|nr:hypothetical protein EYF80_028180 [Liparis tanakae]
MTSAPSPVMCSASAQSKQPARAQGSNQSSCGETRCPCGWLLIETNQACDGPIAVTPHPSHPRPNHLLIGPRRAPSRWHGRLEQSSPSIARLSRQECSQSITDLGVTGTSLSQRDERGAPAVLRIGPQSFVLFAMKTLKKIKKEDKRSKDTASKRLGGVALAAAARLSRLYFVDQNLSGRGSFGVFMNVQLWRNGHYLPVSSSIKKPPCPSCSCVSVPTGGGTWASSTLVWRNPELPSALAPIICPNGRARGPNEPFGTERKEGANCSCDVGVVVPFNAFAMATGQRPWKHAAPLSGQRPKGREAASVLLALGSPTSPSTLYSCMLQDC